MTTKEFQCRVSYFSILNRAALYFNRPDIKSVFKLTLIYMNGSTMYDYSIKCEVSDKVSDLCYSIWFDRFSRKEFEVQLGYFIGFLNCLSDRQLNLIKADNHKLGLEHLFDYLAIVRHGDSK